MSEYQEYLASHGTFIYLAVFANCVIATLAAFARNISWEKLSIRCGLFLVKASMLVSGKIGPAIYFCLTLQLYHFSRILNRRFDSRPGATFTLQMLFCFFTAMQYFYRSN